MITRVEEHLQEWFNFVLRTREHLLYSNIFTSLFLLLIFRLELGNRLNIAERVVY